MSDQVKELAYSILAENLPTSGALATIMNPDIPLWENDPDFINPFATYNPIQTWAVMGERKAIPKTGIITFSAKPKQGKSLSTYALCRPLLSGIPFDCVSSCDTPKLIIVFDTEMSREDLTSRTLSQINAIGENKNRFAVVPLKDKNKQERRSIIATKVKAYNPDIIVIDQAADLIDDFNNVKESNELINWLVGLSSCRSVWTIIHQNKSKEDSNMRGHVGTMLEQKAEENYSVERNNGIFAVTLKSARRSDPDNAEPLRFSLDADGNIIDATAIFREKQQKEIEAWRSNMDRIFGGDEELKAGEIVKRIMEQDKLEERAAKTKVTTAKEMGVIYKIDPTSHLSPYAISKADKI